MLKTEPVAYDDILSLHKFLSVAQNFNLNAAFDKSWSDLEI